MIAIILPRRTRSITASSCRRDSCPPPKLYHAPPLMSVDEAAWPLMLRFLAITIYDLRGRIAQQGEITLLAVLPIWLKRLITMRPNVSPGRWRVSSSSTSRLRKLLAQPPITGATSLCFIVSKFSACRRPHASAISYVDAAGLGGQHAPIITRRVGAVRWAMIVYRLVSAFARSSAAYRHAMMILLLSIVRLSRWRVSPTPLHRLLLRFMTSATMSIRAMAV